VEGVTSHQPAALAQRRTNAEEGEDADPLANIIFGVPRLTTSFPFSDCSDAEIRVDALR
jgi:hypothetical protein